MQYISAAAAVPSPLDQTDCEMAARRCKKALAAHFKKENYTAQVRSFGCQQNMSDGEKLCGVLQSLGFTITGQSEQADLILYNTCAIRAHAEDRVYGNLGALKHEKRRRPELLIGICGCMPQQRQVAQRIKERFSHVDLVFGTNQMQQLPQLLFDCLQAGKRVVSLQSPTTAVCERIPSKREDPYKALVPVMHGCDNFCTYCIVPFVRGRERSRQAREIEQEVRALVAKGYKEITLLGQNVNSYGKKLDEPVSFSELLERLNAIEGEFWIRFMTSHPKDATTELIDTIARCEKVCNQLHLPVQSGSDRVLEGMNRRYTNRQYLDLVDYAKEKMPDLTLTSDIIVGFPGEDAEDFEQTLRLIRRVEYSQLFTFLFSPREGTRAFSMPDPIPKEEKSRWFDRLLKAQDRIGERLNHAMVGKTLKVLTEGPSKSVSGWSIGRTAGNLLVQIEPPLVAPGRFCSVQITGATNCVLRGRVIG